MDEARVESTPSRADRLLRCSSCRGILPRPSPSGEVVETTCPHCGNGILIAAFPSLNRGPEHPVEAAPLVSGEEAACFYHPDKQALRVCDGCGRFLCALCDVPWSDKHLCPDCIHADRQASGSTAAAPRSLPVASLTCHDTVALSLAVFPVLFVFPTAVTGPLALVYALLFYRRPVSFLQAGRRFRWVAAFLLGLLQTLAWLSALVWVVWK